MNKIEISGKAYELVKDDDEYCVFDLEFQKNRFITVGCIGELAKEVVDKFQEKMSITVTGEISIGRDDLFYCLESDQIYIKAKEIIYE